MIIDTAKAPSVPGFGEICQSACFAVLDLYESITTTLAPFFFCVLNDCPMMQICAHTITRPNYNIFAVNVAFGSRPAVGPTVESQAVQDPSPQNVLSQTVAPNLLKNASAPFNP